MLLPLLAASQGVASAQAMVENALLTGHSATATAPMQGLSKGIAGALGNLEKTLQKSLDSPDFQPAAPVRTARAAAGPGVAAAPGLSASTAISAVMFVPVVHYENPKQIETGIVYDELVRRFGPAALEITTGPLTKTLSYMSREGPLQVDLSDGKVTSIVDMATARR
jgi:hypothetical protein